jgi:hypothetical protein
MPVKRNIAKEETDTSWVDYKKGTPDDLGFFIITPSHAQRTYQAKLV